LWRGGGYPEIMGQEVLISSLLESLFIDIPRFRNSMALETHSLRKWQNREVSFMLLQLFEEYLR